MDKPKSDAGYSKPPVEHRFKAGRSGNPKGRPKKSRTLSTILEDELASLIAISEQGKSRKISKKTAVIRQLVNKAMKGDNRAMQLVLTHTSQEDKTAKPPQMALKDEAEIGAVKSLTADELTKRYSELLKKAKTDE